MSTGRVSRIQRRYEENIAKNNQRNYSNNNQRRNNSNNNYNNNNNRKQPQQQQIQQPANSWRESVRSPVQGLTELVTHTVPKVAAFGWAKCTTDTTWEEFDFGNNPFNGGAVQQDFMGDILDDFSDIVERDPFQFDIKPNQPLSRRREEVEVPQAGWANFNAFPQYQPFEVIQAVRYNSCQTPSTGAMTDDDTFYDHGEKMFNVKAIPITEVIPIENIEAIPEEVPHQMSDPEDIDDFDDVDQQQQQQEGQAKTKSARFRPFGGKSKKVQVTVGLPSLKVKSVQDEGSTPIRNLSSSTPASSAAAKLSKEEERLRKREEQLLKEEKEREEERIRLKEERLAREEERLQRERERILEEEERMMQQEEERERRREERLQREAEILRLREERKERAIQEREEREFARIEQQTRNKKSSDNPFLDFEDIDIEEGPKEVDWQGFPPIESATSKRSRRERRRRERSWSDDSSSYERSRRRSRRRERRSEPKEPIKIECPTCPEIDCACCPPFYQRNKKWINLLFVLLILVGLGIGIYVAIAGTDAFAADDEDQSEECKAVMKGFSVPSESLYPTVRLSWVMDISTQDGATFSMTKLTQSVGNQFQDLVIPTLAGCLSGSPVEDDYIIERFDIVNGYVRGVRDVGSCRYGEVQPCSRVLVDFVVFVRGESPVLDLIAHISSQFAPAVMDAMEQLMVVRKTGLVGLFEQRTRA